MKVLNLKDFFETALFLPVGEAGVAFAAIPQIVQ